MYNLRLTDYISSSNEELSDLLAEFDNRLSSGSGHLIGQWLTSGEFAFISILLKKGPEDEDPYEVHGNVKIDDRYSPLWGQEEFGVRWTIKHYLNEWGYLEQMKDLGFDLGQDFKVVVESVHYDKPFFDPPRGMGFHTQANLVIEQANTKALDLIAEILKTGFRCAEITEILYADESNPQINLNINDQLGTGLSNVNFDEELLYIVGEILQKDREAVLSLRFQDMNDEFFGARIYGDAPLAKYNTPTLLSFKNWGGDMLDKEDEFYLDEITDLQEQFLEARIEFFKDLEKKQFDVIKMVEDFEKFKPAIDIIRANPLACPETDIYWKNSENPKLNGYSGTDYGDAEECQVEGIFDEVVEVAMDMNEYDSLGIGKGSSITLIKQELIAKPGNEAIMIGFSSYKLTLPSNINLVVVLFCEGEMDEGKFELEAFEKYNIINPETLDRGLSPTLFAELKSEFVKYFS